MIKLRGRFSGLGHVGPCLHLKLNRWTARKGGVAELEKRMTEDVTVLVIPDSEMPEKGTADALECIIKSSRCLSATRYRALDAVAILRSMEGE